VRDALREGAAGYQARLRVAAGPVAIHRRRAPAGRCTTDFGALSVAPRADARPIDEAELRRSRSILRARWRSFDAAVDGARGKTLTKGPRGGGRDLRKIVDHVVDAEGSYLRMVGRKVEGGSAKDLAERTHAAVLEALETTARAGPAPPDLGAARGGYLGASSGA
jgi:hypothetical protein